MLQSKSDIQMRLTNTAAKRAKIKELVGEGKSIEEVRAAVGDPPPAAPGGRGPNFASFTTVVYNELSKRSPDASISRPRVSSTRISLS